MIDCDKLTSCQDDGDHSKPQIFKILGEGNSPFVFKVKHNHAPPLSLGILSKETAIFSKQGAHFSP